AVGAKLSILGAKCRDRSGATFVVEMQLLHIAGFMSQVVYDACRAHLDQLEARERRTSPTDVIVISICEFVLWPDEEQDAAKLPRVPMLSWWNMTERLSSNHGLLQVQYAFLELPKLPKGRPETGAELWAWLFVHTPELKEIPPELPPGPYRRALELANEATFTPQEINAYRRVMDEIQQARDYGATQRDEGRAEGFAEGKSAGYAEGMIEAILAFLETRGIAVDEAARMLIQECTDATTLARWLAQAATASSVEEVIGSIP
ncbi:MAG TPA: PD-(D/E)XK nuclease family transposase, partial [Candidatus Nanopelagicales bacterium]|nr:PD-(D/E)XK nuclease family transposase [Candidatus Nanopelagicales bacterium]